MNELPLIFNLFTRGIHGRPYHSISINAVTIFTVIAVCWLAYHSKYMRIFLDIEFRKAISKLSHAKLLNVINEGSIS